MTGSKDGKLIGGCACGAITCQSRGEAKFSIICQCRQCQRITGSGHAASFAVPDQAVTITGEVT